MSLRFTYQIDSAQFNKIYCVKDELSIWIKGSKSFSSIEFESSATLSWNRIVTYVIKLDRTLEIYFQEIQL